MTSEDCESPVSWKKRDIVGIVGEARSSDPCPTKLRLSSKTSTSLEAAFWRRSENCGRYMQRDDQPSWIDPGFC